ncbi:glycosyltransferase family 4 protein, partial [Candidatus Altiarchaeota archaeon]
MKIAYVSDVLYPYIKGGCERRIWELSRRLVKRGHEVHIYSMKFWEGENIKIEEGVVLHGVCPATPLYKKSGRRSISQAINFSFRVFPPLLRGDYDLIECNQFPYLPIVPAKICSILKRKPLAVSWHEVWGDYWYEYLGSLGFFGKLFERLTSGLPEKIIAVSRKTKEALISLGIQKNKIILIPNGVDISFIQSVKPEKKGVDLIFVGRLIPEKNVDVLLKALARIVGGGRDVSLVIVGEGPEKNNLISLAAELNVSGRVSFLGYFEEYRDLIAVMKSAKLLLLPSSREGFGLVV